MRFDSRATWATLRCHATPILLGCILLLGLGLRWGMAGRGLPYLHHWDEPFVANRALEILRTGDFNPHFFNYGSLVVYADAAVDALHYLALAKLPDGDPEALRQPQDIRFHGAREDPLVTAPEQEPYWVSHPSFYLWNRRLTALFGTLAIALTFTLARRLAGDPMGDFAGLLAALILATNGFAIDHSAWITTDLPAATFSLAVLFFTLAFVDSGDPRRLLGAFAALGLAMSTKYNAAIVGLVPFAALALAGLRRRPGHRPWLWIAGPTLVGGTFLLATPYALLDLPTFLRDTGRMLYAYLGNPNQILPVEPGWPHLRLDLGLLAGNLGLGVAAGAVAGFALALRRARAWVVLPIGLLALWATSGTRTPFHRNLILCYPLAAIAFALAAAWAWGHWQRSRWHRLVAVALVVVVVPAAGAGIRFALHEGGSRETRSRVVDVLAEVDHSLVSSLGIARELNLHPLDLARIDRPYIVRPLRDLICSPVAMDSLLLPTRPWASFETSKSQAEELAALRAGAGEVVGDLAPERVLTIDSPIADPGLELRRPPKHGTLPLACVREQVPLELLTLDGESGRNPQSVGLGPGASAKTPAIAFPAGRAQVALRAAAVDSTGTDVELVAREIVDGAPGHELGRWKLRVGKSGQQEDYSLPVAGGAAVSFAIEVPRRSPSGALLYGLWVDSAPDGTEKGPV